MTVDWKYMLDTKEKENFVKNQFLQKISENVKVNVFENIKISVKGEIFSVKFSIDRELKEDDCGFIQMQFESYLRQLMRNYNPGFVLFCGNVEKISKVKYVFNAIPEISEIEAIELIKNSIRKNTINVENLMNIFR